MRLRLGAAETQRLQQLNNFKSKVYTNISHEFRTPLTLIAGPVDAQLNKTQLSEPEQAEFMVVRRNINRLVDLVDQMLHLATLEQGQLPLRIAYNDLGVFLQMIASAYEYRARAKNMEFVVQIAATGCVWFDQDAVEKICTNLLDNAFKYAPTGGQCTFALEKTTKEATIRIENSLTDEILTDPEQLFTRFYQQDEHRRGLGIGLSLVRELIQLYGGEVQVQTTDHRTIRFEVRLPLEREALPDAEVVAAEEVDNLTNVTEEANSTTELPVVLIVEDHREIRSFLTSSWRKQYRIAEAENGQQGWQQALKLIPDLVVSDIRMPGQDGIALCRKLKADERTSHIPVVLLTARSLEEDELRGLQSGADDFVTKPFNIRTLEKRVANLISSRRALRNRYRQETVLQPQDIAIAPPDEALLARIQRILDQHLTDPSFNAEGFARMIGLSRMQLHRKLQAFTGLSTTAFIRSQRLKQALPLLSTSQLTINEVAYSVGFSTPSYFIKCFKETYHKTPAEYRRTAEN